MKDLKSLAPMTDEQIIEYVEQQINFREEPHTFALKIAELARREGATQAQDKWVSVEERLPEKMASILIFDGEIKYGYYSPAAKMFYSYLSGAKLLNVTHYQPLPPATKNPLINYETK